MIPYQEGLWLSGEAREYDGTFEVFAGALDDRARPVPTETGPDFLFRLGGVRWAIWDGTPTTLRFRRAVIDRIDLELFQLPEELFRFSVQASACRDFPQLVNERYRVDAEGRLLVIGNLNCRDSPLLLVLRFDDVGLDPSFGEGGISIFEGRGELRFGRLSSVALGPEGPVVALRFARSEPSGRTFFGLVAIDEAGRLREDFGEGGVLRRDEGVFLDQIAGDGDWLYAAERRLGVARFLRLTPEGEVDATFGDGGFVPLNPPLQDEVFPSVIIQQMKADGRGGAFALGTRRDEENDRVDGVVYRVDRRGLDLSFGSAGVLSLGPLKARESGPQLGSVDACGDLIVASIVQAEPEAQADSRAVRLQKVRGP